MEASKERLPSLASGHGLPSRQMSFCDGRTSIRAKAAADGFDLLVHYAHDSWCNLSRVLVGQDAAMRWEVDGAVHGFDWVEAFPFGYCNREDRDGQCVISECVVEQGVVQWCLEGVRDEAVFRVPLDMFVSRDERERDGSPLLVTAWDLPAEPSGGGLGAVRTEKWLFKDSSTYAGIEGKAVASEAHESELHLWVVGGPGLSWEHGADEVCFRVCPDAEGRVVLVLGLGSDATVTAALARQGLADPGAAMARQRQRYAAVSACAPDVAFGRHTALHEFAGLTPLYLESMRIADEPGAFRANNDYYWVWGWDMTRPAFALLDAGQHEFVRELLELRASTDYINQYDNTLTKDLRWTPGLPGALEYMLAHDYLAWTGDNEGTEILRPSFVSALEIACDEAGPTGMRAGAAASTDFPEEFGRTFKAWLAYTTAWSYSGYCCAEKLLRVWGEVALADRVRDLIVRIRRNFAPVFWNEQTQFWNEGVHPTDSDLVSDIPLSTALAAMDSAYGEDLYGTRLEHCAEFAAREFLRDDGVHITVRDEVRGWKEWTRQPKNWFAANDTMLTRLLRSVGDARSLEKLFYLYEINFGYQPAAFEGKPLHRPLNTSGSWQAFGAGGWYRGLIEAAAGIWVDLGGITIMPCGLREPIQVTGLRFRDALIDVYARGEGTWPVKLSFDGQLIEGTTKLPLRDSGDHIIEIEYGRGTPEQPVLTLAVDAEVRGTVVTPNKVSLVLSGDGYTPVSFFSPGPPQVTLDGRPVAAEWNDVSRRGRARVNLAGESCLEIVS